MNSVSDQRGLSRDEVAHLGADRVHDTMKRVMLVDGYDIVLDLEKSQGIQMYDAKSGEYYWDVFSFFASWPVTYNHPKMKEPAFVEELTRVALNNPSNSDIYTKEMAKFVATFERVAMPSEFKYCFFITGGTLAVENAIKCAFDWKVRKNLAAGKGELGGKVLHFREAFHGRSGYCLTLTNTFDPNKTKYFPKFNWPRVSNPKMIFPLNEENLRKVIEAEAVALAEIEQALIQDGDDIACIILETIQAEGGDNHFRLEFLMELRRLADKYEVLLVMDEVQSGVGLTGKFWAYQHYAGFVPDLVIFGKKMQICGFISTARVDTVPDNVFHVSSRINSTWGGNLTDMVRSRRILEIIEEDNLVENAAQVGQHLMQRLHELQQEFPTLVSNVRGKGMMCAFDLPSTQMRKDLIDFSYEHHLLLLSCGSQSIRWRPHLNVTREDLDRVLEIVRECLRLLLSKHQSTEGRVQAE